MFSGERLQALHDSLVDRTEQKRTERRRESQCEFSIFSLKSIVYCNRVYREHATVQQCTDAFWEVNARVIPEFQRRQKLVSGGEKLVLLLHHVFSEATKRVYGKVRTGARL